MARKLSLPLFVLLVFSWTSTLHPQEAPCTTRTVIASVFDKQGNPVPGLTAKNFRGKFRGKPVEILSATLDTRPRRIVLLLDASGSMIGQKANWDVAKMITTDTVRFASPQTSLALMIFSTQVLEKVGFTPDRVHLLKRVAALREDRERNLEGPRKTALYDAVEAALHELNPPNPGDAIYVITDGMDNTSASSPSKVEEALVAQGVRLFAFLVIENEFFTAVIEEQVPDHLRSITGGSGGNMFTLRPNTAGRYWSNEREFRVISENASALYQQMERYYRLEVRLPSEVDKPREWKLEVVDADGKQRNDLNLTFTRRLLPCPEQPAKPH